MNLIKVVMTWIKPFFITLLLCQAGVVWALARVESRASPSSSKGYSDQANESVQNASLDTLQRIEYLQREMQELRGKVEEQAYQMQQMQEQHKKLYMDLDKRLREAPSVKASTAPQNDPLATKGIDFNANEPNTSTASSMSSGASAFNEEKAYQEAYRLVQNKDFDGALRAFTAMVTQAPQGKYAPNGQYWLGEIYLTKGDLDKAQHAFTTVYQQHPLHPKAADSLLKLGYVEYNRGQYKQCQTLLNQVKIQFPGTTSAQLADSRLQRMQQEGLL